MRTIYYFYSAKEFKNRQNEPALINFEKQIVGRKRNFMLDGNSKIQEYTLCTELVEELETVEDLKQEHLRKFSDSVFLGTGKWIGNFPMDLPPEEEKAALQNIIDVNAVNTSDYEIETRKL